MKRLDAEQMARIVSRVTQPLLGLSFQASPQSASRLEIAWKAASLPNASRVPLTVAVAANDTCCRTLGAIAYGAGSDAVDEAMVENALWMLVNMTAGLLTSALESDVAIDLVAAGPPETAREADGTWTQHYLKADQLDLLLMVATGP